MIRGGTEQIRKAFILKETRTLNELYKLILDEQESDIRYSISKHHIRSIIYSMKKTGEIKRIADSTYKKV
jgi:hypothetical protein